MTANMPTITMYGPRTTSDSEPAGAACARERMNIDPRIGVITAPTALNDCATFNRCSEVPGGPRNVTYGFADTSRNDCPHAITKSPSRNTAYIRTEAAGI